MTIPDTTQEFGELRMIEYYEWHDFPLLFTCVNAIGEFWVFSLIYTERKIVDQWAATKVSKDRLQLFRSARIDFHELFAQPEFELYRVDVDYDWNTVVTVTTLDETEMPKKGIFVDTQSEEWKSSYGYHNYADLYITGGHPDDTESNETVEKLEAWTNETFVEIESAFIAERVWQSSESEIRIGNEGVLLRSLVNDDKFIRAKSFEEIVQRITEARQNDQ